MSKNKNKDNKHNQKHDLLADIKGATYTLKKAPAQSGAKPLKKEDEAIVSLRKRREALEDDLFSDAGYSSMDEYDIEEPVHKKRAEARSDSLSPTNNHQESFGGFGNLRNLTTYTATAEDAEADAEFGIEKNTSPSPTSAPIQKNVIGKLKDRNVSELTSFLDIKSRSLAKSTEQTVALAVQISKEVDKGPVKEDPVKLKQLAKETQASIKRTVTEVAALNEFLVKKSELLKAKLPEEKSSAQRITEIASSSVKFAESEVKLAFAAAARDEAVKAAQKAIDLAKARRARATSPTKQQTVVGKLSDHKSMHEASNVLMAFTNRIVACSDKTLKDVMYIQEAVNMGVQGDEVVLENLAIETKKDVAATLQGVGVLTTFLDQRDIKMPIAIQEQDQIVTPVLNIAAETVAAATAELKAAAAELVTKEAARAAKLAKARALIRLS